MKLVVCSSAGTEASVKRELEKLGVENPKAIDGKIEVEGDFELLAKLSVWLRCADRILVKLAEFKASSFDELFDGVNKIRWSEWLKKDAEVKLNGNCFESKLMAIKTSGSIVKKAIMKNLENAYHSRLTETGDSVTIYFTIIHDICTICLDASGDGLHKRGYRTFNYTAPLKETLACSMLDLSIARGNKPFADLFCGSGTIAIEFAMIAKNIAPGLKRHFDFEKFKNYPVGTLEKMKLQAKAQQNDLEPNIYACDINPEAIKLAKIHARQAGVEKFIKFEVNDMRNFAPTEKFGVIISNPPYGERISNKNEVSVLYKEFGKLLKTIPTWSAYVLTDNKDFEKLVDKRANKKRKLYNARIECVYYSFLGSRG